MPPGSWQMCWLKSSGEVGKSLRAGYATETMRAG